jgi:branched-chain amino acid aminotransferase
MTGANYINFNGSIVNADHPVLLHTNRAFRYGDALFETIRLMNGEILFLDKHLARLKRGMELLSMNWSDEFSFHHLHLLIRHLDQVNNLKGNGRIRIEVFRKDGGFYTPLSNDVDYIIEAEELKDNGYFLNETGLRVDLFTDIAKPINKLASVKSSNALLFIMAGLHRKKTGFDEVIILNTEGNISESVSSNIFLLLNGELCTPSPDQGCIAGVMRERLIELMKSKGKKCIEKRITLNDLLHANEVFLTNTIDGIRWVGAIRNKRYFNTFSRALLNELVLEPLKKA